MQPTQPPERLIRSGAEIIAQVCRYLGGISEEEVLGRSRQYEIVYARHLAMYLLREQRLIGSGAQGYTYEQIGAFFDRAHTTVIDAVRKIAGLEAWGGEEARQIRELRGLVEDG